jgi:hypothetical protein
MKRALLLGLSTLAFAGCGGSVTGDPASGGSGGSGASGGGSGSGGSSGSAGADGGPVCCTTKYECWSGSGEDDGPPAPVECVEGVCKPALGLGQCWQDSGCQYGKCVGAFVCPCGMDCHEEDHPGSCAAPPVGPCCTNDMACGDYAYVPCVNGVCKQLVAGGCWKDDECPDGTKCVGASVCPCTAMCATEDQPGKCQ